MKAEIIAQQYLRPDTFSDLSYIRINQSRKFGDYVDFPLGHFESFGYKNRISGPRRLFAALIQTTLAIIILPAVAILILQLYDPEHPLTQDIFSKGSFTTLWCFSLTTFGAVFWREQNDMYQKWKYLADLFNYAVKIDPPIDKNEYNKREHISACLAHDILTMGMWAHRSFKVVFKEIIERAILHDNDYQLDQTSKHLKLIAKNGLQHDEALRLISSYINFRLPQSDQLNWYLRV